MADEEIRDEEPEVEAHGTKGDKIEGSRGAQDEDDSDDVEAHSFKMGTKGGANPNFKEGGKA